MDLADIRIRVQRQFGDESEAQISLDDIDRWANDALIDIVRKTECLQGSDTDNAVAGQEAYTLPADFLFLRRMTFDGIAIRHLTIDEMDNFAANRDDAETDGTPRFVWIWGGNYNLYPRPSSAGVNNIAFQYVKRAAELTMASDIPAIPVQMHEEIVRYCLMRAYELNEDWDAARRVEGDYEARLAQARYETYWPHADTYPAVRLLPGDDEHGY